MSQQLTISEINRQCRLVEFGPDLFPTPIKDVKTKPKTDRDTPVRQGDRYCSPRCGRGCTHQEFKKATDAADVVVSVLGPQWKPRVWENLGWHWAVETENCTLHQFASKAWWADLNVEGKQYTGNGETVREALEDLHNKISTIQRNVELALIVAPTV